MAEFEDTEGTFRVDVPGFGNIYWLLDLPDDGSPIVKYYTKILAESCDLGLANFDCLNSIVKKTVSVIKNCSKTDAIRLGSQCNRLTKYIEATAVYLCNFKGIAMHVAEELRDAMKHLYSDQPPRDVEAEIMLNDGANIASIVLQATKRQLDLITKLSSVTVEGFTAFLKAENAELNPSCTLTILNGAHTRSADAQTLASFNEAVQKLFVLWNKLAERLRTVSTMTNEIKENIPQVEDEGFNEFKEKVIKISANWIAVRKMCLKYIDHMYPPKFKKDAEGTIPQDFDTLNTHFNDIEVLLLAESDCDLEMESSIRIYSSWVQPKLDITVYQCSELAEGAKELVSCFDSTNASKKLVEIKQQSKHVAIMITIYVNRLDIIEMLSLIHI